MPKHSMLNAFNLFKENTENNRPRSSDWGRLRTATKSAAILSVKEEAEDGTCKETVHHWGNDSALNRQITELRREEVPATPPKAGTKVVYNAVTPDEGTKMSSSGRSYELTVTDADQKKTVGTVHVLSPEKPEIKSSIFSPPKPRKKGSKTAKRKLSFTASNKENIPPTPSSKKRALIVKPNKKPRKTDRTQVSVTGASPNEEWKGFQELLARAKKSPDVLQDHPELAALLERMENDPNFRELVQNDNITSQRKFASEWLHKFAHCLAGANTFEAQAASNLALGPKWINSFMMVLEKLALATSNDNSAEVSVESDFEMIPATRIVDTIEYKVHALSHEDNSKVDIGYKINALEPPKRSNCASNSDAMHIKTTAQNVLKGKDPIYKKVFQTSSSTSTDKPLRERLRSSKIRKR